VAVLVLLSGCAKPKTMDFSGEPTRSDVEFIFTPQRAARPSWSLKREPKPQSPACLKFSSPRVQK
jgi:hypothetical protein